MIVLRCDCLYDAVLSRVSVRVFRDEDIPEDILMKVLRAGIQAPTAAGAEQWFFIVVKDREKRLAIHKLLLEAHRFYAVKALREPLPEDKIEKWMKRIECGMYLAPVYIAAYIDLRDRVLRDEYFEIEKIMAIQSLSAAIENMLLVAHSMGLGGVWLGVPVFMKRKFDEVLEPPPSCDLQAIVAIGYPAEEVKPRKRRKSIEFVVKFL